MSGRSAIDEFNATEVDGLAVETGERLGAEDPAGLAERFKETYAKWEGLMADIPADDLDAMAEHGVRCFLIGEALMRQDDVEAATRALIG